MMQRLKELLDTETFGVWFATIFAGGFSLAKLDAILSAVMLVSTIIYTWMRIIGKRKDDDEIE